MKVKYLYPDESIGVDFGIANYSRDGEILWEMPDDKEYLRLPVVGDIERIAAKDPDHDWRIYFAEPMWDEEYQRQPDGRWKMIRKGRGFA